MAKFALIYFLYRITHSRNCDIFVEADTQHSMYYIYIYIYFNLYVSKYRFKYCTLKGEK